MGDCSDGQEPFFRTVAAGKSGAAADGNGAGAADGSAAIAGGDGQDQDGNQGQGNAEDTLPAETKDSQTRPADNSSKDIRPDETLPEETRTDEDGTDGKHSQGIRPDETLPEETREQEGTGQGSKPEETGQGTSDDGNETEMLPDGTQSGTLPDGTQSGTLAGETQPETLPEETQPELPLPEPLPEKATASNAQQNVGGQPKTPEIPEQEDTELWEEVDGVLITVRAEAGVLPEDARLEVKSIEGSADLKKIGQAVDLAMKQEKTQKTVAQMYTFDISIYSGDEEIEPGQDVTIAVRLPEQEIKVDADSEETPAAIFHLDAQMKRAKQLDSTLDEDVIEAPVEHFSPFAVVLFTENVHRAGYVEAGTDRTVKEALDGLTTEEVANAGGHVTLCLTGNTSDANEVFIPRDKGITRITVTGSNGENFKIGADSDGAALFANGIPLVLEHAKLNGLYGGGKNIKLERTDLTITGGEFLGDPGESSLVVVGGSIADVRGADVSVTDSCNITIENNTTMEVANIYGGCYVDAPNATARIGETNLTVRDSEILACMVCGGSFVWSRAKDALVEVGTANITFENTQMQTGYVDFTFSIYGGHVGNNKVDNLRLLCGTTNITVEDTTIDQFGSGGEIFGGHYNVRDEGAAEITLDHSVINLKNSTVNGVFGGGYYAEKNYAYTETVDINVENCTIRDSAAMRIPIICGGDRYDTKKASEKTSKVGTVNIQLSGTLTGNPSVYAEGVHVVSEDGSISSIFPDEAHLTLDQTIRAQIDDLDLDSIWTDAKVVYKNGGLVMISEYSDYADLIQRIKDTEPLETDSVPGQIEKAPAPEEIETPALPEGSTATAEELNEKKTTTVNEILEAIKRTVTNATVPDLSAAVGTVEEARPGDTVQTYLNVDILDIKLEAEQTEGILAVKVQKLVVDVIPKLKIIQTGTSQEKTQSLRNDQLSGASIEFRIGIPDSVTASRANVVHHAESGDEIYETEVEQDEDGKFLRLHANSFSIFEISLLYEEEPDVSEPDVPTPQPQPDVTFRDSDSDSDSSPAGSWVQDEHGWWYQYKNGTWPREQWAYLVYGEQYAWYYFDQSGYMKDGWLFWNGHWYYLQKTSDGARGRMYIGWHQIDGKWYYFETAPGRMRGALYMNCRTPDGYTVGADGSWVQ